MATTAAGTYLGYRHYNKLKKNIDNKRNNILNDNNLSKEQRDELLKKLKDPSKAFELFRGGVWGYAGGKLLSLAATPLYGNLMVNKLKKSEDYNTNAGIIDLMREHAKRNGYYTPELDSDTRGIYN